MVDYTVDRPVLSMQEFKQKFSEKSYKKTTFPSMIARFFRNSQCRMTSILPLLTIFSFYNLRCFASDIIAGLTMSVLHVPQGLAYGMLAGVKPINGLYTSFFPVLVYILFGSSRHLSVGTYSVVCILTSDAVYRLRDNLIASANSTTNPSLSTDLNSTFLENYSIQVVTTLSVLSGLLMIGLAIFRASFLLVYISTPLLGGFTCASSLHVLYSQFNNLFGFQLKRHSGVGRLIFTTYQLFASLGQANLPTVLLSLVAIAILLLFKYLVNPRVVAKCKFPIPIELFVLIAGTVISYFAQLKANYDIEIVGKLPTGFPSPVVPSWSLVPSLLSNAVIVAFVTLATSVSLAKYFAARKAYSISYASELVALGLANIFGGFFQCHPASGALARSSVSTDSGMQSQVASLISCCALVLVLTTAGPVLRTVPLAILSSIITVSLTGIFKQFADLPKLYRICVSDMLVWIVTFLATVLIDVPLGLLTGLAFSQLIVAYRTQTSFGCQLGRLQSSSSVNDLYVDVAHYSDAIAIPGIIILKFNGPLYFANADSFSKWLIEMTGIDPIVDKKLGDDHHHHVARSDEPSSSDRSSGDHRCECVNHQWSCFPCLRNSIEGGVEEESIKFKMTPTTKLRYIVLDVSSWLFIDSVGLSVLKSTYVNYKCVGIQLIFTAKQRSVDSVMRAGRLASDDDSDDDILDAITFTSLHDAVLYCQEQLSQSPTVNQSRQ